MNLFSETLNFTYTFIPPPDGAWGVLQEDGTWNGMMNLIQKEEVDFGRYIMMYKSKNCLFQILFVVNRFSIILYVSLT